MTVAGLHHCTYGLCLSPGKAGELAYDTVTPPQAAILTLSVWMPLVPGMTNRLAVSTDGGRSFRTIAENFEAVARLYWVDLPPGCTSVLLRIDARNQSSSDVLCVDQLILTALPAVPPFRPLRVVGAICGLGLCLVLLSKRPGWALLSVLVVCAGAWLRLEYLLQSLPLPLETDAEGYAAFARTFSLVGRDSFYSAHFGMREPLFICLAHYFFLLVGDSDYQLRLFSFLLSVVFVGFVPLADIDNLLNLADFEVIRQGHGRSRGPALAAGLVPRAMS